MRKKADACALRVKVSEWEDNGSVEPSLRKKVEACGLRVKVPEWEDNGSFEQVLVQRPILGLFASVGTTGRKNNFAGPQRH